ncbi:hypothetical protein HHI36_019714 [Cryptolaemus montrouzieri]|uniref:Peptidase A2 domain-containing protein n=1 Tax=Cryptolaemus montrouzieri TaxID=559131 RepID=A0ABD2N824_9CUCU
MSVSAILERVEELSCSRHVTKLELFDSAIDLFKRTALTWFRANRKKFTTWKDISFALKKQFLPYDHDDRLFEEAKRRPQGEIGNIGIYADCMTNSFSRLSITVPESTQLKIMLRNLNPLFQLHLGLTEVTSIDHLIELCDKLEMKRHSVESYSKPLRTSLKVAAVTCWNCNKRAKFGKLVKGTANDSTVGPEAYVFSTAQVNSRQENFNLDFDQKVILNYIMAHSGKDERPNLKVNLYGEKHMELLDSGATRTIMGKKGWDLLSKSKVVLDTDDAPSCSVVNGESCPSIGSGCLPIDLMGKIKLVNVLIVPSLKHCLILG